MGKSQKRIDLERRLQETHHLAREVDHLAAQGIPYHPPEAP